MKSFHLSAILFAPPVASFVVRPPGKALLPTFLFSTTDTDQNQVPVVESSVNDGLPSFAVRAPLKYIGPYPALGLNFPKLATESQRSRNISGVALDFLLDTAANTNTINGQVASELGLPAVGSVNGGVGATGAIAGGEAFLLGDAALELPTEDGNANNETFMTGLTAAALPVASPAAAGLLSFAFMQPFDGIAFQWLPSEDNKPPSVTFFDRVPESALNGKARVKISLIPLTELPTINVRINGVELPALLDTGSPVTVLNEQAAKKAGITTFESDHEDEKNSFNPFAGIGRGIKQSQAAARGEVLSIMGSQGQPVNLWKSKESQTLTTDTADSDSPFNFGSSPVFVGDLPGLAALEALPSASSEAPALVLGMDVLRHTTMLLRARQNEVWFNRRLDIRQ